MNTLYRRFNAYKVYRIINTVPTNVLPASLYHAVNINTKNCLKSINNSHSVIRFKSKTKGNSLHSEENELYDDEADFTLKKDSKVVKFKTTSLRADLILKSAMGISRNKIEELFYESKIRVNGKKILKKSVTVHEDSEIDVIKNVSPNNPDHLYVTRINILSMIAEEENIQITARRFKNLLIENYEIDPYKGKSESE